MYYFPDEESGLNSSIPMGMSEFNPDSLASFSGSQVYCDGNWQIGSFQNYSFVDDPSSSNDPYYSIYQTPFPNGDITQVPDFPDDCLKFINDILMEEELDDRPTSLHDYNALQATEKSLYDALGETYPPSYDQLRLSVDQSTRSSDDLDRSYSDQWGNSPYAASLNVVESNWLTNQSQLLESASQSSGSSSSFNHGRECLADSPISTLWANELSCVGNIGQLGEAYSNLPTSNCACAPKATLRMDQVGKEKNHKDVEGGGEREEMIHGSRGRKNHQRENSGHFEERGCKQLAADNEEYVEMEKFDDVLICKEGKDDISPCTSKSAVNEADKNLQQKASSRGSKSKSKSRGKKKSAREVVDLRTLLTQCAQAVASFELTNADGLLKQIRQHASQFGDSVQRVAHYFANALEAHMAGTGSDLYKSLIGTRISSSEVLRGYKLYVSAIPFTRTSYFLANQTIAKLAEKATKVHIIDFGIFFGFQWPCLIQNLSRRPLGPPRLKITGVDFPGSGFKPAQKVQETGRRLEGYCNRYGVPFEFHAIAQRWHTLKPDDFNIEKDELVVVTCLYNSRKLPDESVDVNSPRDSFLRLIKNLNPNLFIHGAINGTFNAPFFITRFREALYHYSCLFDVLDATIPREDNERLKIENYLYGKDALNIVACEGSERIERPETYKQWQLRKQRAGFKQVPLDQDVVNRARTMVKSNYHKDFMVEQDRHWMVQGWKGRILLAISCWKPA